MIGKTRRNGRRTVMVLLGTPVRSLFFWGMRAQPPWLGESVQSVT
jgi:hypothetical protein